MSMNKLFFSVVSLLALTSCASEYKIEGSSSVSRLDGKMLFIKVPDGDRMVKVDSAEVIHGIFKMEGVLDSSVIASLYMDDINIMPFVIEKGKIAINIDNARIVVSGTPLNDRLYDFVGKKTSLDDRAYELERKESRMIMDGKDPNEIHHVIMTEREKLAAEMNDLAKQFIKKNYDNVFIMICGNFDYPVMTPMIEEIVKDAPDSFKNNPMVKEYITVARANMEKLKSTQPVPLD